MKTLNLSASSEKLNQITKNQKTNVMTIKTRVLRESEVNIDVPAFWVNEDETEYIGVLSEKQCITWTNRETYKGYQDCETWVRDSDIEKAYNKWTKISEEMFLKAHQSFFDSLTLQPILIGGQN